MQKTILITGSSSGIGYDAAKGLAARGWRVFATCRQQADCDRLNSEGLESLPLDLADETSIAAAVDETLSRTGGKLDALYNNGAIAIPGFVEDLPTDALRAIFETNVFGWHSLTRRLLPALRKSESGRIVNCSSVLGLVPAPYRGAYVSTKYALEGLTDVLRLEMRGSGLHVVLIEPGPVTSRLRENAIVHFERWIDTEGSVRAADYARLKHRLYQGGRDFWELPASAVTRKLIHAVEDRNPKPRYYVTTPTYMAAALRRLLPTRWSDPLLAR